MITMQKLWESMMDHPNLEGTAILGQPITLKVKKPFNPKPKSVVLKAGTKVRVVMASRMGDVGITSKQIGYVYETRIQCETMISDSGLRYEAQEGVLTQIELVE